MTKAESDSDVLPGTAAVGDLVATAGQRAAGDARSAGFAAELESALTCTAAAIRAAGGAPEQVLQLRVFVTDMGAYLDVRHACHARFVECFGGRVPPTTVVEVAALADGAAVEVEALAGR